MSSNDSPSEIADGTTDATELVAEYEQFRLDIEEQPLPSYRTDELRARIETVRGSLASEGVASAAQLQQLLRTVTEALADVRAARVVPVPEGRDLSQAVAGATDTGAAYEVTETEQRKTVNVLLNLLFTVVETPTHEDRRRGDEGETGDGHAAADGETATENAGDADTSQQFAAGGYAGPE